MNLLGGAWATSSTIWSPRRVVERRAPASASSSRRQMNTAGKEESC